MAISAQVVALFKRAIQAALAAQDRIRRSRPKKQRNSTMLQLEHLEDRMVPSGDLLYSWVNNGGPMDQRMRQAWIF